MTAPIALALDAPDLDTACRWANAVDGVFSHVKVGLETYLRDGALGVAEIRAAAPHCALFLDLKLHDIPNTMVGAARSVADLQPDLLTVHAAAGHAGIAAVAEALPQTKVAAVTVLTSLSAVDLTELGTDELMRVVSLDLRTPEPPERIFAFYKSALPGYTPSMDTVSKGNAMLTMTGPLGKFNLAAVTTDGHHQATLTFEKK